MRTKWIARTLVAAGISVLAAAGIDVLRAAAYQRAYVNALRLEGHDEGTTVPATAAILRHGSPIGWLEIPRLRVSVAVVHGDADDVLNKAIGHLPDTPLPWDAGNSALAAHRDTFFRPLRHVRPGDLVRLRTPRGNFEYRVRQTYVVDPDNLRVLAPTPAPTLTLITCYPFNYVGPAPRRFIVQAERIKT
jgi:sortase A